MPRLVFKFKGQWTPFRKAIDPARFGPRLERYVGHATKLNAYLVARRIRKAIKDRIPPGNADLTAAIKRSTKPLVDRGDLWKAVTIQVVDWKTGFAGLLRTARTSTGEELVNLGVILHEGTSIRVTDRMRRMFRALARATNPTPPKHVKTRAGRRLYRGMASDAAANKYLRGRARELYDRNPDVRWKPLAASTTVIRIPGRPFLRDALEDQGLRAEILKNWSDAVARALGG